MPPSRDAIASSRAEAWAARGAWLLLIVGCAPAPSSSRPARPLSPAATSAASAPAPPGCDGASEGAALAAQGHLLRGVERMEREAALCPGQAPWRSLIEALLDAGKHERARAVVDEIAGRGLLPEGALAGLRARAAEQARPPDDRLKDAMRNLYTRGQAAFAAGDHAQARALFEEAWRTWHPNGQALERAGLAARLHGDAVDARRLFDRAVVDLERAHPGERLRVEVPNGFDGPTHVAFSRDGSTLLVGHGGWVSVLSAASLRERSRFDAGDRTITAMALSPDGRWLAVGSIDGMVRLWEGPAWQPRPPLGGHRGPVAALAFLDDGALVSSGADGVQRWDTASGRPLPGGPASPPLDASAPPPPAAPVEPPGSVALGGALVARRSERGVALFDTKKRREVALLPAEGGATALSLSPDGKTLAVGRGGGYIDLWNISTRKRALSLSGHTSGAVVSMSFSPDGRALATGGDDRALWVWDTASGRSVAVVTRHSVGARAVAALADGSTAVATEGDGLAVLSKGGRLRYWETGTVTAVASAGTTLAMAGQDRRVMLVVDGKPTPWIGERSGAGTSEAQALALSPDGGTLLVGGPGRQAFVWDVERWSERMRLPGHDSAVTSVAISPTRRLMATGSTDRKVRVWDGQNGTLRAALTGHQGEINAVAFSPDGMTLASGASEGHIRLWRVGRLLNWDEGGEMRSTTLAGHGQSVSSVAFSPDGQWLLSGGLDGSVRLWSIPQEAERWAVALGGWVRGVAFTPDGRGWVAARDEGSVVFGAVSSGERTATARLVRGSHEGYAFSPAGQISLLGSARQLRELPICRIGRLSFSFDLCEEQASSADVWLERRAP